MEPKKVLPKEEVRERIQNLHGLLFSVNFYKKNGEFRKMLCRTDVKKYLKGGELPFDIYEKGLVPVYDIQKEGYRMIPIDRVESIKLQGENYEVS